MATTLDSASNMGGGGHNRDIESQPNATGSSGGYERLSQLMGHAPETAIFRRFGAISAQILLHQQAEIHDLEIDLRDFQRKDRESGHEDRVRYDLNFVTLSKSRNKDAPEGNNSSQWDTIVELKEKMRQYEEGLLRHRQLLELGRPPKRQVKGLRDWMRAPSRGDVYLQGSDHKIWVTPKLEEDLVALGESTEEASFTHSWLVNAYNRLIGRHFHRPGAEDDVLRGTIRYTDAGIFRVFRTLSSIVASIIPVAGIAALYAIHSIPGRIGAIAGFTAVFSLCLCIITSATIKDIFIATTTFTAVLVVFVGSVSVTATS